ncbi:MAG: FAD-dependent oxidoreductase [Clostridiales bacterium]|nr:FAD-dependent oxidoreductase [Clostridiales bacterium]
MLLLIKADVIVCGAGPAGIAAAIQAAKAGADTLLIEKDATVGGMSTLGMINVFCGVSKCYLFNKILREKIIKDDPWGRLPYDPEEMVQFYIRELDEAGVRVLLGVKVADVKVEDKRIVDVSIATSMGMEHVSAPMWIDATGDGLLAYLAGVPFHLGRETDGAMQPMTMMVMLSNVYLPSRHYLTTVPGLPEKMEAFGKTLPGTAGHIIVIPTTVPGNAIINMTNCGFVDGTDIWDYTKAQMICRKQVYPIVKFLRENAPGCENCFVLRSAAYAGIRESRHFKGKATLTEEDILAGRVFDDWVVTGAKMGLNVHNTQGSGMSSYNRPAPMEYTIPYGAYITDEVDNLFLSGRMISGTHVAHGSYRAMSICMAGGQAVGGAAALCVQNGWKVDELPVGQLQDLLRQHDVPDPA